MVVEDMPIFVPRCMALAMVLVNAAVDCGGPATVAVLALLASISLAIALLANALLAMLPIDFCALWLDCHIDHESCH